MLAQSLSAETLHLSWTIPVSFLPLRRFWPREPQRFPFTCPATRCFLVSTWLTLMLSFSCAHTTSQLLWFKEVGEEVEGWKMGKEEEFKFTSSSIARILPPKTRWCPLTWKGFAKARSAPENCWRITLLGRVKRKEIRETAVTTVICWVCPSSSALGRSCCYETVGREYFLLLNWLKFPQFPHNWLIRIIT